MNNTLVDVTYCHFHLRLHDIVDSIGADDAAKSAVGVSVCSQDYIEVSRIKIYKAAG